ncbi:MAG: hypothetical protein EXS36_18205 [Pedosphaera sp.]|nr:hypothetical protein [Pedosphaera sp.]
MPPARHHAPDAADSEEGTPVANDAARQLREEQIAGKWFAALVPTVEDGDEPAWRFSGWREFMDFVETEDGRLEVWTQLGGGSQAPRRVTAFEMGEREQRGETIPTFLTVSWRGGLGGGWIKRRVEFGFGAARTALEAATACQRHRKLQRAIHDFLGAKDNSGRVTARAQWDLLQRLLEGDGWS